MSGSANVIQEFLVALGYNVDSAGLRKFDATLQSNKLNAEKVGVAIIGLAVAVEASVARIAAKFEDLFYASQKLNATVQNIQSFTYAVAQMGGKADQAQNSLANFAQKMRTNPAFESFVKGTLGVPTRDATGKMRDWSYVLQESIESLKKLPYWQQLNYASFLGVDEDTLRAINRGLGTFREEFEKIQKAAGVNPQALAAKGQQAMQVVRTIGAEFAAIGTKIEDRLLTFLVPVFSRFRDLLMQNLKPIADGLGRVLELLLTISNFVISSLAASFGLLFNLLKQADDATHGWSTKLLALLVAWRLLNSSFLASPIGVVLALIVAIGALYDDYQTWKDHGDSLIDWSKWSPAIESAIAGIRQLLSWINQAVEKIGGWKTIAEGVLAYMGGTWVAGIVGGLGTVVKAIGGITTAMETMTAATQAGILGLTGLFAFKLGTWIYDTFLAGTSIGDAIGHIIARVLAFFGNKDAQGALDRESKLPSSTASAASGGTGAAGPSTSTQAAAGGVEGRIQQAIKYFIGQGWTKQQAAGIAANLVREDDTLDPSRTNSDSGAYGIAQWLGKDRLEAFKKYSGKDIKGSTFEDQLGFIQYELTHNEKRAGDRLRAQGGADDSARSFNDDYERNGNGLFKTIGRENLANDLFQKNEFGGGLGTDSPQAQRPVTITSTTHVTVPGTSDPQGTAKAVGNEQGRVQADLLRNTRQILT